MKNLLTACLLFVAFATSGQKATTITTSTDDFTGAKTISTGLIEFKPMASYEGGVLFSLHNLNGGNYLAAILSTNSLTVMDEGQRMIIKMADGSMINLVCMEYAIADYNSSSTYHLSPIFEIIEDDMDKLASVLIEKIRFETSDGNIDREPSKKSPATCMAAFAEFKALVK